MFGFGLYTQVSDSGPHGPLVLFGLMSLLRLSHIQPGVAVANDWYIKKEFFKIHVVLSHSVLIMANIYLQGVLGDN